ncbi:outer membrane beta-barrel protein [Lutimonas saemankumensis]|uniref:outer membrane beta-barrel protein n=1 Tax=Lutimonas saemankumensis TaxID=483016 RepID=UPI001CD5110A|nr:outer membrane beta-barrel protein [Lutimonas saemankumensis]MCA0933050.1 outer membrane beta-barrel protein [Lutimonas saemankumensis]
MLERKNIDRVFQENLKDLEIYPNKRVWSGIEGRLNNRKRRSVALWKKLSAAAILSGIILTAGLFYQNNSISVDNQVVEVDGTSVDNSATPELNPAIIINDDTELAAEMRPKENKIKVTEKPIFVKQPNNKVIVTDNEIATIYSSIEDKYIVDKEDFLQELKGGESITARMEAIPEKKQKEKIDKKWSVGPTVAPVFYNSLQDGSPLNEALSNNSRSSDNALSVGVKINYQLTNKFFIQSGVNKVELAYNTKDVNALISSSKNAVNNINTDKYGVILTPSRNGQVPNSGNELFKSSLNGDVNQSIEYYELPIEMKYNLYDKRLGLNLVGGFSTLILSNNSVSIVNQNSVVDLGNANNLNDLNFSGNVGVDLDYKLSKSWFLNVAPMFKYQFNTYSGNSGNFRPYYFGLYSGLNYKF